jgi:hypothetical protein
MFNRSRVKHQKLDWFDGMLGIAHGPRQSGEDTDTFVVGFMLDPTQFKAS